MKQKKKKLKLWSRKRQDRYGRVRKSSGKGNGPATKH